nr:hypothetical protein [Brevibacterium marinum]
MLSLLLSGCSVLQIRTAERDSGPVRVAVQEEAGEDPTTAPADDGAPEGMTPESVSLGTECPVEVGLAMADGWSEGTGTDGFHSFTRGTSVADRDVVVISCTQSYEDSPRSVVEAKKKFAFSEQGSTVASQRTGTLGAGYFWSFQGLLGPSEIMAIDKQPTLMYGTRIGYRANGRLVEIGIEMRALESEKEAAEEFEKMLPTVSVDGETIPAPRFK